MRGFLWLVPQNRTVAMRPKLRQLARLSKAPQELLTSTNNQTSRMTTSLVWAAHMWRDAITPRICAWVATIAAAEPKRLGRVLTRIRPIIRRASVRTATWPIITVSAKPRIWKLSKSSCKSNQMLTEAPHLRKQKMCTSPRVSPTLKSKRRLSPPIRTTW